MVGYIYRITNTKTKQNYIGQTIDINRRRRTHFNCLLNKTHDNPKLQASWNKYGKENFKFEYWEFNISSIEELNEFECEYIEKYDGLSEGFNLVPGGGKPPLHQKVKDDDVATFLCVQQILGDGYGKTCEQIFGWSKGTASAAKRKIRYAKGWIIYEQMTEQERLQRGQDFIDSQHLKEIALKRQLTQGGCEKAYQLTQDDFNFAFCAQEMGYSYTVVAKYLEIKPATVKDWFNGRSRKKEKEAYLSLDLNSKTLIENKVKSAQLSFLDKDALIDKKEEELMQFLCYDEFFPQRDADIQRLFGWSESTCYHIREKGHYPKTKKKIELLDLQAKRTLAEKLNIRLQSAMLKLRN